jgi:hypothetical protein
MRRGGGEVIDESSLQLYPKWISSSQIKIEMMKNDERRKIVVNQKIVV